MHIHMSKLKYNLFIYFFRLYGTMPLPEPNAGLLLIGPWEYILSEISVKKKAFPLKMHL